jgi:hypothetical protein
MFGGQTPFLGLKASLSWIDFGKKWISHKIAAMLLRYIRWFESETTILCRFNLRSS